MKYIKTFEEFDNNNEFLKDINDFKSKKSSIDNLFKDIKIEDKDLDSKLDSIVGDNIFLRQYSSVCKMDRKTLKMEEDIKKSKEDKLKIREEEKALRKQLDKIIFSKGSNRDGLKDIDAKIHDLKNKILNINKKEKDLDKKIIDINKEIKDNQANYSKEMQEFKNKMDNNSQTMEK